MYISDTKVHNTTFQQFKLTPIKWSRYMANLYRGTSADVHAAAATNPKQFLEEIAPNLKSVCRTIVDDYLELMSRGQKKPTAFITPKEYVEAKHYVLKTHSRDGHDEPLTNPRTLHDLTMKRSTAIHPANKIPDQLLYHTEVVDEVGRIEVSWMIVSVGLWYHFHREYQTGLTKPVFVGVGSCTQSSVINSTCFNGCSNDDRFCDHEKIKINDLSAITALTKQCVLFPDNLFIKENKHNRRTVGGSVVNHATLAVLRNSLEMNEPVPKWAMEHLVTNMGVSEKEFYESKGSVHLCVTHRECTELLMREKVDPDDVILIREHMFAMDGRNGTRAIQPDRLYFCTAATGVMFKSANYRNDDAWERSSITLKDLPLGVKYRFGVEENAVDDRTEKKGKERKSGIDLLPEEPHPPTFLRWTAVREFNKGGAISSYFPQYAETCRSIINGKASLGCVDDLLSSLNDLKLIIAAALKSKKKLEKCEGQESRQSSQLQPENDNEDDYDIDFVTGLVTPKQRDDSATKEAPKTEQEVDVYKSYAQGLIGQDNRAVDADPEYTSIHVTRGVSDTDDLVFALQQIADNSQGVLPDEVNCSDDDDSGGNGGDWDATKFMEKMNEVQWDRSAKEAHRHQSQRGMKIDNDAGSTKGAGFVNLNIEPKACLS
ncbi:hypothetical protein ElyMa_004237400 [Elysia marginata]|uniref:Uncharacterized protein n=1 Tax=Elysia marginata TaxID=1093978 RepID=A0AAV4GQ30_9GAST|nr:hypothetical protein ElyMa_004237400 [Elysia marginata]